MTKRHFQVTFRDGDVVNRRTDNRLYSHAWRVWTVEDYISDGKGRFPVGHVIQAKGVACGGGFCGSNELARKAAHSAATPGKWAAPGAPVLDWEVVPTTWVNQDKCRAAGDTEAGFNTAG